MVGQSKKQTILVFGVVLPLSVGLITFWIGPQYLRPLSLWGQLALIVGLGGLLAGLAVYSRRRAKRAKAE
jgi:uncharacterized membrane protein YbhN (UPF0104 family)